MGKKKNKKDMDDVQEIEFLKRGLRQAESKADYKEVANIHNQLGNLFRLRGEYEDALFHHKEEGKTVLEHLSQDQMSLGIAYRNIGEVYMDRKEEERALRYIQKYLKIAKNKRDLAEEQRAHITLGRLSLSLVDRFTENEDSDPDALEKRKGELENAERQFTRAHEILIHQGNQLDLKEKELADMKCGTYLNLAITMDLKDKTEDATKWLDKAKAIARHHGLLDNLYRCYSLMHTIKLKVGDYREALTAAKDMIRAAKLKNDKVTIYEAQIAEAKTLFMLDDVDRGVKKLKLVRKQIKHSRSNEAAQALLEDLDPFLTAGVQIIRAEDELLSSGKSDPFKVKMCYETIADNYVTLGNFQKAIEKYKMSIEKAEEAGLGGKQLAALYYSLGATYKDKGDFNNALKYFRTEMEILSGNQSEEFRTQTNIAECMERAKKPQDEIIHAYRKALKLAEGFPKKQVIAYKNLSQYYKFVRQRELADKCTRKAQEIERSIKAAGSDVEEDSQELNLDEDVTINLDELSSPSEDSAEDEEEEGSKSGRVSRKPEKVRRNEKGETQLHIAAQKGDVKAVKRLLSKAHPVNPRDYSGWIPLHEACNFGHYDVVVELLEHNAWVNDPGGQECDGTTPLLDAASNGHFACMRALLAKGASVVAKDKHGNRAMDCLVIWYEKNKELLTPEQLEDFEDMKKSLSNDMKRVGRIYTSEDEHKALRRAATRNQDSGPRFRTITSHGEEMPVKIVTAHHPDEDDGRAGVDEYNEAMSILRRKDLKKPRERRISKSPPKEALLAESQYIGEDWMIPDENLAPEPSTSSSSSTLKRKRDKFEDLLKLSDRSIRRKHGGKRNAIAQMDIRDHDRIEPAERELSPEVELLDDQEDMMSSPSEAYRCTPEEPIIDYVIPDVEVEPSQPAQVTIDSDESDEGDFQPRNSGFRRNIFRDSSPLKSRQGSQLRQAKLPVTRVPRTPKKLDDKTSDGEEEVAVRRASLPISRTMSQAPLRLKVNIMGTKILVPVTQLDQTIDWLCKEVSERHFKETGGSMKLTLSLKTSDGCKLSGCDTIRIAISENDTELTAVVENSHMIELHTRFTAGLKKAGLETDEEAIAAVTRCETSESLLMTDIPLRGKIHDVLFDCLRHHSFLREINLTGCSLHDDGIKKLASLLPTLPNILTLDLSCNAMTTDSLKVLADVFYASKMDPNHKPPVNLRNLILDHNPLGNGAVEELMRLVKAMGNLKLLSCVDCNLTAAFFSKHKKEFTSTLQLSRLESLNMSYNLLGNGGMQALTDDLKESLSIIAECCQ